MAGQPGTLDPWMTLRDGHAFTDPPVPSRGGQETLWSEREVPIDLVLIFKMIFLRDELSRGL